MMKIDKNTINDIISGISEMNINNYVIGGSVSLAILGLINREVHDVDIFTYDTSEFLLTKQYVNKSNHLYEYTQRCFEYKSIWYDMFTIHKGIIRYIEVEYNGMKLKVMNPLETYNMKLISRKRARYLHDFDGILAYKTIGKLKALQST